MTEADYSEDDAKIAFMVAVASDKAETLGHILQVLLSPARKVAKKLDDWGFIYYLYAIVDGLNLAFSEFNYLVSLFISANADIQHDLLMSPEGLIFLAADAAFFIAFSVLATIFDRHNKFKFAQVIANVWPYVRDGLKASKNTYKGLRTVLTIGTILGVNHLITALVPLSLGLGVLAVSNRLLYRYFTEKRKTMMSENLKLIKAIRELKFIDESNRAYYLDLIGRQSSQVRAIGFLCMLFNGVIDGLYLYLGVLSISLMATAFLWPMLALSVAYVLACIASRLFEEYEHQKRLEKTALGCELELLVKELATSSTKLDQEALERLFERYKQKREEFYYTNRRNYLGALFLGIRHGLGAYSAVASIAFMAALICLLTSTSFPPALLLGVVAAGFACIVVFVGQAMISHWWHHRIKPLKPINCSFKQLLDNKKAEKLLQFKEKRLAQCIGNTIDPKSSEELVYQYTPNEIVLNPYDIEQLLSEDLFLEPSPQYVIFEWFEVLRSFFSGLNKGQRSVDYIFNPLQQLDSDGHYSDPPVMLLLAGVSALIFAIVLAGRALARGIGRLPPGQIPAKNKVVVESNPSEQGEKSMVVKKISMISQTFFCTQVAANAQLNSCACIAVDSA